MSLLVQYCFVYCLIFVGFWGFFVVTVVCLGFCFGLVFFSLG